MSTYLDLDTWPRRAHFDFFRTYADPFFNICAPLDVTALRRLTRADRRLSLFVAYHYLALKAAHHVTPFRYRLRGDRVVIHDHIHAGSIVLLDDERFAFCYFDYHEAFLHFHRAATDAIEAVKAGGRVLEERTGRDDLIYFTVLPWIAFTSLSHARRGNPEHAVPKIAFGKVYDDGGRAMMPVAVEVHHALMDGLHVGRYFERLGGYFANPAAALGLEGP